MSHEPTPTRDAPIEERAPEIVRILSETYPDARVALTFSNALEMLVATILSAQCTDEKVNEVTATLFRKYRTPADYLKVPEDELSAGRDHAGDVRHEDAHLALADSFRAMKRELTRWNHQRAAHDGATLRGGA